MFVIETDKLSKSFGGLPVLNSLSLCVPEGGVYGLLGPSGAGKTTLMHLLLGFLRPSAGALSVLGTADLDAARGRVGYLPERQRYHMRYSAREYLRYLGRFSDMRPPELNERISTELQAVGLLNAADQMLGSYSKGMLQRLGLAQALLSNPALLLIDEPSSGLEPADQREMRDLLADVRARGHTVFLTTHVLKEAEQLCDTIGILFNGHLAREIDVYDLRVPSSSVVLSVAGLTPELILQLQRISAAVRCQGHEISLSPNTPELQARVLRTLLDANIAILSLQPRNNPIEDLYASMMQGGAEPEPLVIDDTAATMPLDFSDDAPARRTGSGDSLLRDLLGSENDRWKRPEPRDDR